MVLFFSPFFLKSVLAQMPFWWQATSCVSILAMTICCAFWPICCVFLANETPVLEPSWFLNQPPRWDKGRTITSLLAGFLAVRYLGVRYLGARNFWARSFGEDHMASLQTEHVIAGIVNPLDIIEQVFDNSGWPYDRVGEEEISATVSGDWCDYHLRFFWREDGRVLQTACMFDVKVPDAKRGAVYETLALINERMWLGHFEVWKDDGVLLFRHASIKEDEGCITGLDLCETLIETALSECERYYPVFQFVIWAGKSPSEAIETAMLDPVGNA
jgi:hypothetical protein